MCPKCLLQECACDNPYFQLMLALSSGLSSAKKDNCPRPKGLEGLPPMTVIGTMGTIYDWEVN